MGGLLGPGACSALLWRNERAVSLTQSRRRGGYWPTGEQSISIQDKKINPNLKMLAVDSPKQSLYEEGAGEEAIGAQQTWALPAWSRWIESETRLPQWVYPSRTTDGPARSRF